MTGEQFIEICKSEIGRTPTRKTDGQNYSNVYTRVLGQHGYKGIRRDGTFSKRFIYGVVGHCCIGVQAMLIENGMEAFVPNKRRGRFKYIWNTNVYKRWLKDEPIIPGYGQVGYVTNPKHARPGAFAFMNRPKHVCVFIKYEHGYVYTVDFNVESGGKDGPNNGVVFRRRKSKFSGFANMPW